MARRVGTLLAGSMTGQLALVATAPLLAVLYDPSMIGAYVGVIGVGTVLGIVATLGLDHAVPTIDDSGRSGVVCGVGVAAGITASIGVACLALGLALAGWRPASALVAMVSAAIAGHAFFEMAASAGVRRRADRAMSNGRMTQGVLMGVLQVVLGIVWPSPEALVAGFVLARIAGGWVTLRSLGGAGSSVALPRSWLGAMSVVAEHRAFFTLGLPSRLTVAMAAQLPAIVLGMTYGAASAGHYGLAQRLIGAPVRMLSQAVARVFFGEAALVASSVAASQRLLWFSVRLMVIAGLPLVASAAVVGAWLLPALIGDEWAPAGLVVVLLAPRTFGNLLESPTTQYFVLFDAQRVLLGWGFSRLIVTAGVLATGPTLGWSFTAMLTVLSIAMLLTSLVKIELARRVLERAVGHKVRAS